jgi:signal transduction histidine kinase
VRADFLSGGGEMGARMRALDWSATPLGATDRWPQSLKTIIRVMLDSRYAMWMLWGPEFTFFCNDAYLPTVGDKRDWVLGARSDRVWEEIWPDIGPRIEHVLSSGQATWDERLQLFLQRKGFAEETYHTFSYSPVYDDANRVAGMLCVVTEVTDGVIGERRLRLLRDLASTVSVASSVEQYCTEAADVLTRYPADVPLAAIYVIEGDSRTARHVCSTLELPEAVLPPVVSLTQSSGPWDFCGALASGEPTAAVDLPSQGMIISGHPWPEAIRNGFVLPLRGAGPDGCTGFLVIGVSPRRPLDSGYTDFLKLISGQTAAAIADAQAHERERARAEALAEVDRAKTTFFSNVSHEFRTPLTLMLGPLEDALADPATPDSMRDRLQLAHRNALRLLKLVNSLLDFTRIEAGRVQVAFEPVNLAAVTRDLASTFRSAVERAGLKFNVVCEELSETAYIDREMWEKVVLNLISNAFKFTLEGSITVRLRQDADDAVLEVQDTGVGVPSHEVPRLFDRFYRIEGSPGRNFEGSGIGLALVQELVRQHAGSIEVSSEVGVGTAFTVRFPLGAAHLPQERLRQARRTTEPSAAARGIVQEAERWLLTAKPFAAATGRSEVLGAQDRRFISTFGSRIVLADDNADMLGYVLSLIAPVYKVEAVSDGEAALAAIRRERPDLVISDIMMPKLDGFGLLRVIRGEPQLSGIPVILLSARAGEESRIEGLDAGADDYLTKPFSARELLARVGAMLERTHLRTQNEAQLREREARLHQALMTVSAAQQELTRSARLKDEFLAMLAHELRNPLAPIRNASEVLARQLGSDAATQVPLEMIRRQTTHLTRLVDDLLDVSRITQGRIQLQRQPVDVANIVAQAIETVAPTVKEKRQEISVLAKRHPLYVNGDSARLVQCVVNVLINAAKYTDHGGKIRVETGMDADSAVIRVIDTGIGISADLLPRVFDLFVQGDRTLDRSQGGLGIGLSVVHRLVEMHGGEVTAHSEGLNRGSRFEIRLPAITKPGESAGAPEKQAGPPKRVLIVDDNVDSADSLAMVLTFDGHETDRVYTARAALEHAKSFHPDVVLLDIGLPEMDGYEVARRIRKIPDLERVRLVALTGYGQPEDRLRTESAGFDDHLVKPVEFPALSRAIAGPV